MADTYSTIALIANTYRFGQRVTACAAQQGATDPPAWQDQHRFDVAAAPGFAARVDSWLAANPDGPRDGWAEDQSVISDGDILAVVQPMMAPA